MSSHWNFSCNPVGGKGAVSISREMVNTTLECIDLNWCSISASGEKCLQKARYVHEQVLDEQERVLDSAALHSGSS